METNLNMEILTIESKAFEHLIGRLERIERFIERTSILMQDIDSELEMSTRDLMETLNVSESTLYRWRKKNLVRYRFLETREVRYHFKSLYIAFKCNRLRVSGISNEEALALLNEYKDKLILSSCLMSKENQNNDR